jgi:hypothetical protein
MPGDMSAPSGIAGAVSTKDGPSTVVSVALFGRRWLIASTSIETPSVSDRRMNS